MKRQIFRLLFSTVLIIACAVPAFSQISTYPEEELKPRDSELKVSVGEKVPDFTLPSVHHGPIGLEQYLGKNNIVLSFIPAAWTPVCTGQWPGYNIAQELFVQNDAVLLGISVDNVPTLWAWTQAMGELWFPVLSDFWPHGELARKLGILRSDGMAERALFVIDKKGVIRYIDVHDINDNPRLEVLIQELEKLQ